MRSPTRMLPMPAPRPTVRRRPARQPFTRLTSDFLLPLAALLGVAMMTRPARAQAPVDTTVTYIRAQRMFDAEKGSYVGPVTIRVKGRMIDAVDAAMSVPAGSRIVDLSSFTVLPGLIDVHTHLLYLEDPAAGDLTGEGTKAVIVEGTPLRALHGAARARTFLDAGITTVRDLGNSGRFGDVALRTAINDGSVPGPRMFVSGPGLSPVGGQFPGVIPDQQHIIDDEYRIVRDPADAANAVRENVTFGADVIKIYSNNTPNRGSLSLEEMQAIVSAAKRLGVAVAAHATSDDAVWRAAQAGVTSIEHAYQVADSTLALMAKNGVTLVATDLDSLSYVQYGELTSARGRPSITPAQITQALSPMRDRLRRALKAGVMLANGSDNYLNMRVPQGKAAKRNLFAYSQAGVPNAQVLQAATSWAARLIGPRARAGVIKPGTYADIIAVAGDPIADMNAIEQVRFVMANGKIWKAP